MSLAKRGEGSFHAVGGFALQSWQDVAVGVHRQADLAVAERFHHDARMYVLHEQQRRACVTEIMETHLREGSLLQQSMESMCDVRSVSKRADLAGEYQAELDSVSQPQAAQESAVHDERARQW